MLTSKQKKLLTFIHERIRTHGVSPSFDEMKAALDLASKSGIHRLIVALEERGFIRRLPNRARAVEVLKMPDSLPPVIGPGTRYAFQPSLVQPGPDTDKTRSIPVFGQIAAGVPVTAIQNEVDHVPLPGGLSEHHEYYALNVLGDSMIEAGIFDGDQIILQRTETAHSGDIVVALIDDEEATLKRLRKKGNSVALEAANPAYETRIFGLNRVRIQGRLVALSRFYT